MTKLSGNRIKVVRAADGIFYAGSTSIFKFNPMTGSFDFIAKADN